MHKAYLSYYNSFTQCFQVHVEIRYTSLKEGGVCAAPLTRRMGSERRPATASRWLVLGGWWLQDLILLRRGLHSRPVTAFITRRLFSSMHVKRTCIGCTIDWFPFTCAAVPFTCAAVPFTCAAVPLTCAAVPFTRAPRCPSRGTCTRLYKVHSSQLRNPAQFRTLSVKHRSRLLPLHLP